MNRGFGNNNFSASNSSEKKKSSYLTPPPRPAIKEHVPSNNFEASNTALLQAGQRVEHQKFGFGQIVTMEGASHNPIATIHFEQNGEKKIMLNYAKLRIVE